ncbi:MAG: CsbD family protein [Actinomycetota bacterium]|nr:CsbD family protein [Actinomycetota bacterium]
MANMDEMKGRAKEAAGDLTDDPDLKREGEVDQAKGKTKAKVDEAADKVKRFVTRD